MLALLLLLDLAVYSSFARFRPKTSLTFDILLIIWGSQFELNNHLRRSGKCHFTKRF